ncbi:cobalt/nickel transport system ATP-binding protein [Desulfitispora alkaliphila]|uniref:energy-coupling factor ABC transporter ATP-binding protein n=1 Tax=Desulfitispora alkaliphila TaxID=622674 RepID=UPI003D254F54
MNAVEITGLSHTYADGTKALHNLSLNIVEGTKVAILGANGSGKTTLLYHLNGLIMPQVGEISIKDYRVKKSNLTMIRNKIGMVFDNPDNQLFSTTVAEDVSFGPMNQGIRGKELQERVEAAMDQVGIIDLKNKSPHNLSLGQKKRAAIAGVLAMKPEILVLDEPTSGLDPDTTEKIVDLLEELSKEGKTIILSTHNVDIAYSWAEDVAILAKGELKIKGSVAMLGEEKVMKEAKLRTPLLAKVFAGTDFTPKSAGEANQILRKIRKTQGG